MPREILKGLHGEENWGTLKIGIKSTMQRETKRTHFRRFLEADLAHLEELESDPEIMRFTSFQVPQTKEATKQRLLELTQNPEKEKPPFGVWGAFLKEDESFVGWLMLSRKRSSDPELGFMLVKKAWGQGFATEVSQGILKEAFREKTLQKVIATTALENTASIRVLEKLGFKRKESADPKLLSFQATRDSIR